jgi:hypothetical protein
MAILRDLRMRQAALDLTTTTKAPDAGFIAPAPVATWLRI